VEPDHVGPQDPLEDLLAPRTDAERLGVGPGDVPEDADAEVGPGRLEERRDEGELVVLYQDRRRRVADLVEDGVSEAPVGGDVALPLGGAELRPLVRQVAQGPEALVGESVVVALLLLACEPDAAEGVAGVVRGD
jgi:hypothetical protein